MINRVLQFKNETKKSNCLRNSVTTDPMKLCGKITLQEQTKKVIILVIIHYCIFNPLSATVTGFYMRATLAFNWLNILENMISHIRWKIARWMWRIFVVLGLNICKTTVKPLRENPHHLIIHTDTNYLHEQIKHRSRLQNQLLN